MSSLRRFQTDPKNLLNTALSLYRSKCIKTAVVEGKCDKRFLSQWIAPGSELRFDGFDGKRLVERAFKDSHAKPYSDHDFLYFFADVDFDGVTKEPLHDHPAFIYNVFCFDQKRVIFNDLETYLLNTTALEKVLVNFDVENQAAPGIREKIECASRKVGCLRAADFVVQKRLNLRSSVLNGLELKAFFNASEISIDSSVLHRALPNWSNHKEHVDELIETAVQLDREWPALWSLTRGHDATEMLALHLCSRNHHGISAEKIELMLRLACELTEFDQSPMAKRIKTRGFGGWFANSAAV